MKKLFILIFIFCSAALCYSQTWTERLRVGDQFFRIGEVTHEYTVITKEQFDRLVQQNRSLNTYCQMNYIDVLELRYYPVISGERPVFDGFYYLIVRKKGANLLRSDTILIYGNTKTGRMELEFYSGRVVLSGDVIVDSLDFTTRWNQYISWIEAGQVNSTNITLSEEETN